MRRFILVAALALIALLASGFWHGSITVYYVSPAGSDSNNGTSPATAWQTITKVNATTFSAGTRVLFQGGQTFSGAISIGTGNYGSNPPTASSPVLFGSYGIGRATISSGSSSCFASLSVAGLIVRDLICVGSGITSNSAAGVHIQNSQAGNTKLNGVSLINLDVSQYGGNGVSIEGSNGTSGFSTVLIDSVLAHDNTGVVNEGNGTAGIKVFSRPGYGAGLSAPAHTNVTIQNSKAYNNTGVNGNKNWVGSGIFIGETTTGLIQFCEAYNNGTNNDRSAGPVGIWAADAASITIQFNESHHNLSHSEDGGGFDFDGGQFNSVMQYNYSHDNFGAGYLLYSYGDGTVTNWNNNTVRYNISQNDGNGPPAWRGACFVVANDAAMTNAQVYNNTCYVSGSTAPVIHSWGSMTGHISNNLFYATGTIRLMIADNPSLTFAGNDYFTNGSFSIFWNGTTYNSFAAWQTATGQEKISGVNVGLTTDPKLNSPGGGRTCGGYSTSCPSAYQLQGGSPMLPTAGLNLPSQFGLSVGLQDYYGNVIPSSGGYSVGAHQ